MQEIKSNSVGTGYTGKAHADTFHAPPACFPRLR